MLYSLPTFVFALKPKERKRSTGLERVNYYRLLSDYFGSDRHIFYRFGSDSGTLM